ncbi:CoA-binding protein [Celeribacter halophilus]|jgi:predicted CoA-binding protein|uniref:CoA-binding protein n=2 Tax=Celeribacter halophilus TaxID=576117 RepID=A0AAW7XQZ7_9RHOB|nr:CoA-binding protein [Celeribacter halophilus]MDO6456767.1 CoA-binding protein [Celeribacter halophilus]
MMYIDTLTDADITRILKDTKVIALVGASAKPERPSHRVGNFLVSKGYKVIPVNPGQAGKTLFGETCVASLSDITEPVDMVDIFRRAEELGAVVDEALHALTGLKYVWMQLDLVNEKAAALARAQGAEVVMDRCPAIEIPRLGL